MRRIKGGIVVDLFGVDAFLPGSQIDIRQVKNFDQFLGQEFPFKIIKLNKARRNIVVSRRAVLEEEREKMREEIVKVVYCILRICLGDELHILQSLCQLETRSRSRF